MENKTVKDIFNAFGELVGVDRIGEITKEEAKALYPELYENTFGAVSEEKP